MKRMVKEAKNRVDPDATEDRAAVTAAVKGASAKAPEEKPPNLGKMTQGEFEEYKRSIGL